MQTERVNAKRECTYWIWSMSCAMTHDQLHSIQNIGVSNGQINAKLNWLNVWITYILRSLQAKKGKFELVRSSLTVLISFLHIINDWVSTRMVIQISISNGYHRLKMHMDHWWHSDEHSNTEEQRDNWSQIFQEYTEENPILWQLITIAQINRLFICEITAKHLFIMAFSVRIRLLALHVDFPNINTVSTRKLIQLKLMIKIIQMFCYQFYISIRFMFCSKCTI